MEMTTIGRDLAMNKPIKTFSIILSSEKTFNNVCIILVNYIGKENLVGQMPTKISDKHL
jgi:hypothetical protein